MEIIAYLMASTIGIRFAITISFDSLRYARHHAVEPTPSLMNTRSVASLSRRTSPQIRCTKTVHYIVDNIMISTTRETVDNLALNGRKDAMGGPQCTEQDKQPRSGGWGAGPWVPVLIRPPTLTYRLYPLLALQSPGLGGTTAIAVTSILHTLSTKQEYSGYHH